ncbi:nucleoside/nucleotide kinase family protein [Myceligenerans sp. TRM 65318]|uniref:Nucleoside/nucleotide kinase family protein n=2 Tax=Myceligenerans pegani TaxID=2776917 RepID=A0ABR9N149_9MICO|nr:nucleoside/nucleotide kinase family protein [Myceligenerans sp. TRM 65318]MBE3019650.1 nucleoside/nucleotide kinase family protein [Myceligenerans sp. TRM 65318]
MREAVTVPAPARPAATALAEPVGAARAEAGVPAPGEPAVTIPADLVERARHLADDPAREGRAVLGLTGPPGAGKSTLAAGLAAALGPDLAVVVGMDGFHLANTVLEARGIRDRKGAIDTFDDAGYAELIARIAAAHPHGGPVVAPEFRREIEEPIAGAVVVPPEVPLVITEGNYLLAESGRWPRAREHMTEVWYVDLPDDVRLERLTARHHAHGKTPEAARAWAHGSDQHNAEVVAATRDRADLHVALG